MKRRKSPYLQALEGDTTATKISKKGDPASATKRGRSKLKGLLFLAFYITENLRQKKIIRSSGPQTHDNRTIG